MPKTSCLFESNLTRAGKAVLLLAVLILAGCASRPPLPRDNSPGPTQRRYQPVHPPSFDCMEASSTVQDVVCATDALSQLDSSMTEIYRQKLRSADAFGREPLVASQRKWLLGRVAACRVPQERMTADRAEPALAECLTRSYRDRVVALNAWSYPVRRAGDGSVVHPAAAYIQFTVADAPGAALCGPMAEKFNEAIKRVGDADPSAIPGMVAVAGTHAGRGAGAAQISVELYDPGPYASFALRAAGLTAYGSTVIDRQTLGHWIEEQPNSGGRFGPDSSQTRDYGAIDVFSYAGRQFALVNEAWGFYSPAARGESSYAGLYEIASGQANRQCLFKTYLHPPFRGVFDRLPALNAWRAVLKQIKNRTPLGLDYNELRDDYQLRLEAQWNVLNLPLIALDEAKRNGWSGWLRKRHDLMLGGLFAMSETDQESKDLYRRFFTTLRPVANELVTAFMQTQGLTAVEAKDSANLVIMEMFADAAGDLPGGRAILDEPPARIKSYAPRYPLFPSAGDVERGRKFETAHSAALNGAPTAVVDDLMRYELANGERRLVRAAGGETVLMAAAGSPETVSLLLASGVDPKQTDGRGRTALMAAALTNQVESAKLLIQAGADVNAKTIALPFVLDTEKQVMDNRVGGRTALMVAASHAQPEMAKLLLEHGALLPDYDSSGRDVCKYVDDNPNVSDGERQTMKSLLCGASNGVQQRSAEQPSAQRPPDARVGDRVTYSNGLAGLKCNVWEVTEANREGEVVSKCGGNTLYSTIDNRNLVRVLNDTGETMIETAPFYPALTFPLYVGKKWSGKYEGRQGVTKWFSDVECEAMTYEAVQVAAGKFDAFRVECVDKIKIGERRYISRKGTSWYAPAVGVTVKSVNDDSRLNTELSGVSRR